MEASKLPMLIRSGDVVSVERIVQENPELLNRPDENGFTPLILATYFGHQKIAEVLLKRGADIDARDTSGNTALMGVSFKGFYEIVKLLIDHGADVSVKNRDGETALSFAETFGQNETAKLLAATGAKK